MTLEILIAWGLPSALLAAFFAFAFRRFEKRMDEREETRKQMELLSFRQQNATFGLAEAIAIAKQRGETNGEMRAALEYAKTTKRDLNNFLAEQGIDNLH